MKKRPGIIKGSNWKQIPPSTLELKKGAKIGQLFGFKIGERNKWR